MDDILHSALEEICARGSVGLPLENLWPSLRPALSGHGLNLCPDLKTTLWANLRCIPGLQFEAQGVSYSLQQDYSVLNSVENCEQMNLKIVAPERLRNNFVGIYDIEASASSITQVQRRTLERLAIARKNGITQSELAKEFGIKGNNIFYILKKLESRGLIVRQSTVVRTKEACNEGDSKSSSVVTTNMLHLYRYAKHLGCQQRLEITKEDKSFAEIYISDAIGRSGVAFTEESTKEDVHVKDYLPALKAICDRLEQAEGKVLVVSDIKRDLGYRGTPGHRAWRNICHRLKDAHVVEEFCAKVNSKEVACLRLLKKFSTKHFEPKSSGQDYDDLNAEQPMKLGKRGQITDQLVELPIERQIYDMIDSAGSKGLTITEVFKRLGLRNKQYYDRLLSMSSRCGMHLQAESYNKGVAYRVWTSGNFNPGASNLVLHKPESAFDENTETNLHTVEWEVEGNSTQTTQEVAYLTLKDVKSAEGIAAEPDVFHGSTSDRDSSKMALSVLNAKNSLAETSHRVSDKGETVNTTVSTVTSLEISPPISEVSRRRSYQRYPCLTLGAASAQREQRIVRMLEEEKFLIKPELHRRLENLEKEKNTMMDRKTLERSLNKLQLEGQCKCIQVSVPAMTNLGRSRIMPVVLHPSISTVPEVLGQIHERIRSFDMQVRQQGYSRLKKEKPVCVLDSVQRIPSSIKLDTQAEQAEARRANGFVLAKMVRTKLLHIFLWGYLSKLPDWDVAISLGQHGNDMRNPHSNYRSFELDSAFKAMPLELFLQVVGSTQTFEDLIEKCRGGLCLSDLPLHEYKHLMDTRAVGRLSWLIDVLRRLKLIRLVSAGHGNGVDKVQHATLTHALEFKPYIEEPVSVVGSSSSVFFPDLRPHIRHDFVLSTKKAVEEYWNTLEYCYATANSEAALHAFPGSAVHEVFSARSWASVRVMSADQRAELLKRIVNDDLCRKISFKECEQIAIDLNLTLEQVLRVYYDKRQHRLTRLPGDSYGKSQDIQQLNSKQISSSRKRKRSSEGKSSKQVKASSGDGQLSEEMLAQASVGADKFAEKGISFLNSSEDYEYDLHLDRLDDQMEAAEEQESNEEDENDSFIHKCALSRLKPGRKRKFSWTEAADRQLVIEYVRHRATLGAKFHRTDWGSLSNLPAPPETCRRRMAWLNSNMQFRKALMRLCNRLAERYAKYLEKFQNNLPKLANGNVMVRESVIQGDQWQKFSDSFDHNKEFDSEERWDTFDDRNVRIALDDVLRYKRMAKLTISKNLDSDEWSDGPDPHHSEMDPSAPLSQEAKVYGGRSKLAARRSRSRRFPRKYNKLLKEGTCVSRKVYESVAVSNAVELFKLIFLSTSTSPQSSTVLAETLRRYSQHDLFAAFSYLREKKAMIGGSGTSPFVLSQLFWQSISLSPFPTNTGKRASKFASWLDEKRKDLMEDEIDLRADLQCGDIFHLCALVSRGELSVVPYLPEEGIGETEDSRSSKRKNDDDGVSGGDKSKRMRTSMAGESEIISRREKGFPGIRVCLTYATIPRIHALELFKDEDRTLTIFCGNDEDTTGDLHVVRTSSQLDEHKLLEQITDSRDVVQTVVAADKTPWEAMSTYAEHLFSSSYEEKLNSPFHPELFKTIYSAIQKSGDQGLSMKEISEVLKMPGEKEAEIVVEVLERFGRTLKVHAYDCVHVVDPLYRTKYFLTTMAGTDQNTNITVSADCEGKIGDKYLISNVQNHEADVAGSLNEISIDDDNVHRITILNHPKEVAEPKGESQSTSEVEDLAHSELISAGGEMLELHSGDSQICRHILPWINGDGTINELVYKGLIRRVLGIVMQYPGIMVNGIIKEMRVLNPQSCRKLLETMVTDNHLIVRRMHQTTTAEPPAILGRLFGGCISKSKSNYREHFFANPMSTFLL